MVPSASPRRLRRLAACLIAGTAGTLVLAATAWAAPSISPGDGRYWNVDPTYQITAADGETPTWIASGPEGYVLPGTGATASLTGIPEGAGTLTAADSTGSATVSFTKDVTAPVVTLGFSATPNAADWFRAPLRIDPSCSDASPVSGCGSFAWTDDGQGVVATVTATDAAGNTGSGSATFNYDGTLPLAGQPTAPTGPVVASEPLFRWTAGADATSGVARYEVEWRAAGEDSWETIARVPDTGLGDYSTRRDPALREAALPEREPFDWRVRTVDTAGNPRVSSTYRLTIDPTVPPAPTITGGPNSPIRFTSPTFTWTGTGESYLWELTIPGRQTPVRVGPGGPETEVTLTSLSDGDYTFSVSQVTAAGQRSEAASRSFKVDTTPPVAPVITVRPAFPAAGTVSFGWSAEAGASSRWQVIGAGGAPVLGPTDTPLTSVSIANLADGAYSFQVLQMDAAGNASATTAEPFTMSTPAAPGAPTTAPRIAPAFLLPTQNAFRLRPKAGRTLPTRSPVLGWRKGPRGTRLYNVQIFKVVKRRAGAAPTVKKIFSGFPSKRQMRAPRAKMQPGTCYVWRVWPYTGTRFTPKPLGISNFCVAKASVLKKKTAQAAARRKAAQRR